MASRGHAKRTDKRFSPQRDRPKKLTPQKRSGSQKRRRPASTSSHLPSDDAHQWSDRIRALAVALNYPEEQRGLDQNHLSEACTHRTFAHEFGQSKRGRASTRPLRDNQRLEFLGDAVLGMMIASELMTRHPEASEGQLSATRAQLINAETLADVALNQGLESHLRIGRGEANMGEHARRARLADLTEAVIGALYLDLGLVATRAWVWGAISLKHQALSQHNTSTIDPKTALQHWAHRVHQKTPTYRHQVINTPPNEPLYQAQVLLDDQVIGQGEATTKKLAHFAAARDALDRS